MIVHNIGQPSRRGKSKVIDLVITSATHSSTVASCDTLAHEMIRSDHVAILTELTINKTSDCDGIRRFRGFKKVSKGAKIRSRYHQVPHLTQDIKKAD